MNTRSRGSNQIKIRRAFSVKYKLAESALPTSIDAFESYEIGIDGKSIV